VGGESEDMKAAATLLDSLKEGMVTAYARKSGQGREAISKIMDDETWMDAAEAVANGFADEVGGAIKDVAAFDLTKFKRPPSAGPNHGDTPMTKDEMDALTAGIVGGIAAALKPAPAAEGKEAPKSEADIKAALKAEMKAYSDEVTSLCALAGLPAEAAAFIAAETPVAEVRAKLIAKQAEKPAPRSQGGNLPSNHSAMGSLVTGSDEDISDLIPKVESSSKTWDRFNGKLAARH
jgi:ATP-dependent Clp protease protease subunit